MTTFIARTIVLVLIALLVTLLAIELYAAVGTFMNQVHSLLP